MTELRNIVKVEDAVIIEAAIESVNRVCLLNIVLRMIDYNSRVQFKVPEFIAPVRSSQWPMSVFPFFIIASMG